MSSLRPSLTPTARSTSYSHGAWNPIEDLWESLSLRTVFITVGIKVRPWPDPTRQLIKDMTIYSFTNQCTMISADASIIWSLAPSLRISWWALMKMIWGRNTKNCRDLMEIVLGMSWERSILVICQATTLKSIMRSWQISYLTSNSSWQLMSFWTLRG